MTTIDVSDFYDYETLTEKLHRLVEAAPDLVSVESLTETPEGRNVWCATVASEDGGTPVDDRPALLVTANMHALELAGSWVGLHLLGDLVDRYPDDETVASLLEERTVYVVPRVTPDGAEVGLTRRGRIVRSRYVEAEPEDIYDPNVVVPEDLDGDGRILQMRWEAPDGDRVPIDGDGPAMVSMDADDDGPAYHVTTEGVVANHDGGEVSDPHYGYRRSDFNRNFPSKGWNPLDWEGHGKYPLSEPETRAVAEFLYDHPNVTNVVDLHTGNPAIFYPAMLAGSDPEHPGDANLLSTIGERGEELTGFDYVWGYGARGGGEPSTELPGSFKDFVYERLGVPTLLVELGLHYNYPAPEGETYTGPGTERERMERLLEYQEEHPERPAFHEWETVEHPQLGEVEVGGIDRPVFGNPPAEEMPGIAERVTSFILEFADYRPDVRVEDFAAEPLDGDLYRLSATVINRGRLPTNLTERGIATQTNIPDRPRVELAGDGAFEFVSGRARRKLDHLDERGGRADLEWVVRATDGSTAELSVTGARGIAASDHVILD